MQTIIFHHKLINPRKCPGYFLPLTMWSLVEKTKKSSKILSILTFSRKKNYLLSSFIERLGVVWFPWRKTFFEKSEDVLESFQKNVYFMTWSRIILRIRKTKCLLEKVVTEWFLSSFKINKKTSKKTLFTQFTTDHVKNRLNFWWVRKMTPLALNHT